MSQFQIVLNLVHFLQNHATLIVLTHCDTGSFLNNGTGFDLLPPELKPRCFPAEFLLSLVVFSYPLAIDCDCGWPMYLVKFVVAPVGKSVCDTQWQHRLIYQYCS